MIKMLWELIYHLLQEVAKKYVEALYQIVAINANFSAMWQIAHT